MAKWHVSSDGTPSRCHAKIKCRLSDEAAHGESREEALRKYERTMAENLEKSLAGKSKSRKQGTPKARKSTLSKSQRPVYEKKYSDRSLGVTPEEVTVPHDASSKYAVLSDVDGTLTRGSLVLDHAIYLHKKGVINLGDLPEKWKADPKNEALIVELAEKYRGDITGMKVDDLLVDDFLEEYTSNDERFYSTLGQLKEFKRRGWEIQLISGSPDFLVRPFAERHGFFGQGSEYHVGEDGALDGSIDGMFGHEAKSGFIARLGMSRFKRVLAFGDTASDVPLFENSHHSTLVDPSEETAAKVEASLTIRD